MRCGVSHERVGESDMNQLIVVYDFLERSWKRLKPSEKRKRRELERLGTWKLCDITLAVAEAGHRYGRRHVARPLRLHGTPEGNGTTQARHFRFV